MSRQYLFGLLALASLLSRGSLSLAQNISADAETTISGIIEEALSTDEEETDQGNLADELYHFMDHPLDLNTASAEDFRQLHLLTEFQIFSLQNYISEHGILLSLFELQLVYGFDRELIGQLLPFICLGSKLSGNDETQTKNNHLHQALVFRTGLDGERKAGYLPDSSGTSVFEGRNRALFIRYEGGYSYFTFGFTAEQDAGESFKPEGKKFQPDFTSAYLEYKSKKLVKNLILGDYRFSCGQGLVLGGFSSRKGTQVLISPQSAGLKKYSSSGENDFFRGIATTLGYRSVTLDLFASSMSLDASLHKTESETDTITYFSSTELSGLHRSISELGKKDVLVCKSYGGHAELSLRNLNWGISYLNQQFNIEWIRNSTAYTREIFPAGTTIRNIGTDFKVSLGKMALFGELAADTKARVAAVAGFLAELHPLVRLSMVYRNYQPDYLGLKSSGFGESQGTKNEEGFYLGLELYPWKYMKAVLYADHYSFPFLRYNSTNPYSGNDYLLNLSFYPTREFTFSMRFRYEKNQNRSSTCKTGIDLMETAQKGGYRLELNYDLNKNFRLKSRLELSYFRAGTQKITTGFYSGHDMAFTSNSGKFKIWFRYAIFDIPNWDNRIYAYENDVLYSFSVPAFSSKGTRFIIMTKANLLPGLEVSLRYAISQFHGQRTWGTGDDEVSSGSDSYWTMQMKVRF